MFNVGQTVIYNKKVIAKVLFKNEKVIWGFKYRLKPLDGGEEFVAKEIELKNE